MNKIALWIVGLGVVLHAHFLTLLPSRDSVWDKNETTIAFDIAFMHPFEQSAMDMEAPKIYLNNRKTPLPLTQTIKLDRKAWRSSYTIKTPSVYRFFVEPQPYFESAEEKFIVHIPKVIIGAFGMQEGWDEPIGLKYEIVPLTKPFGLYVGNQFRAKVLHDGKPAPDVEVEVELYNVFGLQAPTEAHITQIVKTDANGIFSFTMNHKGWWGFAALIEEGSLEHEGRSYPVENGALMWIKAY